MKQIMIFYSYPLLQFSRIAQQTPASELLSVSADFMHIGLKARRK